MNCRQCHAELLSDVFSRMIATQFFAPLVVRLVSDYVLHWWGVPVISGVEALPAERLNGTSLHFPSAKFHSVCLSFVCEDIKDVIR